MKRRSIMMRVVAVILAVIFIGSVIVAAVGSMTAGAVTASQSALNNLKDQAEALAKKKQEIQAQIDSTEYEQFTALAKKAVLDEQASITQEEIDNTNALIDEYNNLIDEKEIEINEAQQEVDKQWDTYRTRIRAMEENGKISYFEILFNASSFTDLLGRIDYISEIMEADRRLCSELADAKQAVEDAKTELESAVSEQEAARVQLMDYENLLTQQVAEAQEFINSLEDDLDAFMAAYEENEAAEAQIDDQIAEMEKELERIEREKAAAAAAAAANNGGSTGGSSGGSVSGTGSFIWPSAASRIVTSPFGTRFHPISHQYKTHNGIDIGAAYGTAVLAADGGTVTVSTYSSSYGNYIVINHNNGTKTLYAHMSSRYVEAGDSVSQGSTIGAVGSTGYSTGPHLHFEVFVNGSRVNPLNYFTNYTTSY